MGGAFLTLSDDENALFYNPAGLNDVKSGYIAILSPLIERSQSGPGSPMTVQEVLNRPGPPPYGRFALYPNYIRHNFGLGLLAQVVAIDPQIRDPVLPLVEVNSHAEIGVVVGVAYGFSERVVQIGGAGKFVERWVVSPNPRPLEPFELDVGLENKIELAKGVATKTAFAFDLGTKVNIPVRLSPTVAVVAQNLSDLDFKEVGMIPSTINAAVAINPDFWILGTTWALEYDDIGNRLGTDSDRSKRLHLGAELRFPKILSLRGGINQGYLTAGFSVNFWLINLAYATYAEEVGAYAGQRGDRRHLAQLTFGF